MNIKSKGDVYEGMRVKILRTDDVTWSPSVNVGDIIELRIHPRDSTHVQYRKISKHQNLDTWLSSCSLKDLIDRINRKAGEIVEDDLTKEMRFFFGCRPSDPRKLPPPPARMDRSYDPLLDD